MGIGRFFNFIRAATDYIHPENAEQAGDNAQKHSTYHRRIVVSSAVCGVVGGIAGIAGAVVMGLNDPRAAEEPKMLLLFPVVTFIASLLVGCAIACMLAPKEFLAGPIGSKWMKLIGTESVFVARVVCFVLGVALPAAAVTLLILFPPKA